MAPVIPIRASVDAVLTEFERIQCARVAGRRRQRVAHAVTDLRRCFEHEAGRVLTDPELHLLAAEQQFDRDGAAARVAEPDALLLVLPTFLNDPAWHGAEAEDRRIRAHLALSLMRRVLRQPGLDGQSVGCEVWSIEAAVERSLTAVRAERGARIRAARARHEV